MQKFLIVCAGLLGVAGPFLAQTNVDWRRYAITPAVGAWTISSAYFAGDMGAKFATDFVEELWTNYRLRAYIFNRAEQLRQEQEREIQEKRRQQEEYLRRSGVNPADVPFRMRRVRIDDEYLVLIGGYPDMETAHKELERIKKLPPPKSVPVATVIQASVDPNAAAGIPGSSQQAKAEQIKENPFAKSFVARNPTIPVAHEASNKPDPFWKELNAYESYSLLKCKQPWTLAVKEFHGAVVVQPKDVSSGFLEKLFGGKSGEQLSASAQNAHNLAEALHKLGFDAYVLHTRTNSIVTVGGFQSATDSRIAEVREALKKRVKFSSNDPQSAKFGMQLFAEPQPMEVPRF
jgi:hypothetical protein